MLLLTFLRYKYHLLMKEAALLSKCLPHHLGKFDGLQTEVNLSVERKNCSPPFQISCTTTSRLSFLTHPLQGRQSLVLRDPLPAITIILSASSPEFLSTSRDSGWSKAALPHTA